MLFIIQRLIMWQYPKYTAFTVYRCHHERYATVVVPLSDGRRSSVVVTDPEHVARLNLAARSRFDASQELQNVLMTIVSDDIFNNTEGLK